MTHFSIPCIVYQQRPSAHSPSFALFSSSVEDLRKWAAIKRREETPQGPQRRLSKAKINAIRRFLETEPRNTILPAITVTLDIDPSNIRNAKINGLEYDELKLIEFDLEEEVDEYNKPGIVIDGQHRLLGIEKFDPSMKVNVVAMLNVNDMEKAFQFLVINNKVTRVSSDLIRTLALDYQKDELAERLRTARLSLSVHLPYVWIMQTEKESPFYGNIDIVSHEGDPTQRFVAPAAIENAIGSIQNKGIPELENDDALCEFIYAIWRPIKEAWEKELWNSESKLMHKVSIVAVTEYMRDALFNRYDWEDLDLSDPEEVCKTVQSILKNHSSEFWKAEWTMRVNDTRIVRDKIIEAIKIMARNIRLGKNWYDGIEFVILRDEAASEDDD